MILATFSPPPHTQQLPPFRHTNKLLTCLSPVENKNSCPHSIASILIGRVHSLVSYYPRFRFHCTGPDTPSPPIPDSTASSLLPHQQTPHLSLAGREQEQLPSFPRFNTHWPSSFSCFLLSSLQFHCSGPDTPRCQTTGNPGSSPLSKERWIVTTKKIVRLGSNPSNTPAGRRGKSLRTSAWRVTDGSGLTPTHRSIARQTITPVWLLSDVTMKPMETR